MGPSLTGVGPQARAGRQFHLLPHPRGVPRPDPRHRPAGHRRHHADVGLQHGGAGRTRACSRTARSSRPSAQRHQRYSADARATIMERPSRPFRSASIPRAPCTARPRQCRVPRLPGPTSASTRSPSITTSTPTWPRWKPSPTSAPRPPTAASAFPRGVQPQRRHRDRPRGLALPHQRQHPALHRRRASGRPAAVPQDRPCRPCKALEELTSFDPSVIVGVLGGGAGTTRDCFEPAPGREVRRARRPVRPQDQPRRGAARDHRHDVPGAGRQPVAAGGRAPITAS